MKLDVEGARLHVEVDGSPEHPALLLWPPERCTLRVWDHLVPRLAERFRVVRVDIRGCGQSSRAADPETQYTLEQYAGDAGAVLDHFGIERCHVWSQSWGSRAAMVFCALTSRRVLSAALYAANIEAADVPAQREGTRRAAEERREAGVETLPPPVGFTEHAHPEAAVQATQAASKCDLAPMVARLAMPVLIATGSHDPNLASSRVIAARAPQATLRVLERCGHNGILEHPQLALDVFLEFQDSLAA